MHNLERNEGMDNEMIERVAEKICENLFGPYDAFEANEAFYSPSGQARNAAKEAIKAMREPTEKMVLGADLYSSTEDSIGIYQAMIDAVIND